MEELERIEILRGIADCKFRIKWVDAAIAYRADDSDLDRWQETLEYQTRQLRLLESNLAL